MGNKLIDLNGLVFGDLTVISRSKNLSKDGSVYWNCKCKCGRIRAFRSDVLRKTNIKDCGCIPDPVKIGDMIGRILVKEKIKNKNNEKTIFWKCECQCENKKEIIYSSHVLRASIGTQKSCGCLNNPSGNQHPSYKGYKEITGRFFNSIKRGAVSRKLIFNITIEKIWDLFEKQNRKCALSNIPIQFGIGNNKKSKKYKDRTASLDRIDSSKGYIYSNIQWIHKDINYMKRYYKQQYFIDLCKKIAENN